MEGNELPNGWPLGLGIVNSRIMVVAPSQLVAPPQAAASRLHRCSSFSSFSSSNLDTESTASFFPDRSVSLGRLIGIKTGNKGILLCENEGNVLDERSHQAGVGAANGHTNNSQGICAPLLHHVIGKFGRGRTTTRN